METTYNPIGKIESYENKFFSPIPIPPPGCVYILSGGQSESRVLAVQKNSIPLKEDIRRGKYCWVTPIDIQPHQISFDADLLSKDNISCFRLTMTMTAHVKRPDQVCLDNTTDVTAAVKSEILPELQTKAILYDMDKVHELRESINKWLRDVTLLNCGIELTNIHTHLQQDQKYINDKLVDRAQEREKEEKLRKLREKQEYELKRAEAAAKLSEVYSDDTVQAFAELASGAISPEDAAKRLAERRKSQAAGDFDEKLRQMKEVVGLIQMMQDSGLGTSDILAQKADEIWRLLPDPPTKALSGAQPVPTLPEDTPEAEDNMYAPPLDG